ncbi:hypothetical protein [Thermogemmatispora tikiterensis]|uniref:Uncharacterized protein n=1 Tax=Thermogemmatispora tikiterensis TaxID=1825093 RepID=A0A328VR79_9CHLR|nr:hypothetical protein [Thermogemmatispora tikiterensis]RAQ97724.1 hypothetical protein A4R35_19450 [Thermogemmatispora tikiterensis]
MATAPQPRLSSGAPKQPPCERCLCRSLCLKQPIVLPRSERASWATILRRLLSEREEGQA